MTDITTVPDGNPAQPSDQVMILRGTSVVVITIADLVAATFAAGIQLNEGTLLGRASNSDGPPQPVIPGAGLALAAGELLANGKDHLGLNVLPWMDTQAEFIVNSAGEPARLPFWLMREFFPFSAGNNVTISSTGVISVDTAPAVGALLDENGLALIDENGGAISGLSTVPVALAILDEFGLPITDENSNPILG